MPEILSIVGTPQNREYTVVISAPNSFFARSQSRAWLRRNYPTVTSVFRIDSVERLGNGEVKQQGQRSLLDFKAISDYALQDYRVTLRAKERL